MCLTDKKGIGEIIYKYHQHSCHSRQRIFHYRFGNRHTAEYLQVFAYHHEKYDGSGYPDGLKENVIPICAQVGGIPWGHNKIILDSLPYIVLEHYIKIRIYT